MRTGSKFLVSAFLTLTLFEIALRVFWTPPFLNPKHKRNDFEWISRNVSLNRFGYRDSETDVKKESGAVRIYALGDSYTYGWYINNVNDSYPSVLENLLKVEAINASRPGFNFEMTMDRLENEGLVFNPDIVTLGINIQDLVFKEFPPRYVKNRFVRSLRLYWLTHGMLERKRVGEATLVEVKKAYTQGTEENKKAEESIKRFADLNKKVGAESVLIVFPEYDSSNPNSEYKYSFFHEEIARIAKKYSVTLIDLYDTFAEVEDKSQLVLNPNDAHPSIFANRLAGEKIYEVLTEKDLVRRKAVSPNYYKKVVSLEDPITDDLLGIIAIYPSDWVYFDVKNELSTQTLPLPADGVKEVPYLANSLKTAFAGKHGGWAGAKLEYHVEVKDGKIFVPKVIYGFDVLGVDGVQVFWRVDGAQNSEALDLFKLDITRDDKKITVSEIKRKNPDFARLTLDLFVSQLNLDQGKVVGIHHSEVVDDPNETGYVSRANYSWVNDRQVSGGSVGEIPVLVEGPNEGSNYPEVEYIK